MLQFLKFPYTYHPVISIIPLIRNLDYLNFNQMFSDDCLLIIYLFARKNYNPPKTSSVALWTI